MLRKIIALFLVVSTTVSVPGFTVFVHYCNGKTSNISVFNRNYDPCVEKEDKSCCVKKDAAEKSCCNDKFSHEKHEISCSFEHIDCCETQVVQNKGCKILSYRPEVKLQTVGFVLVTVLNSAWINSVQEQYTFIPNTVLTNVPPLLGGKDICVKVCRFLI